MKARHKDTGEIIQLAEEGIISSDGRHFCWYQVELIPEPIDEFKPSLPDNLDEAELKYIESSEYPPANEEEEMMVYNAFKAGAEWQKEQVMKEAVEADVNTYEDLVLNYGCAEFVVDMPFSEIEKFGDKARIIILKEAVK